MASEETRERVLAKSLELFSGFGLHRTTFTEIARAAGISRPTLYGLFRDKSRLCAAVIERSARETTQAMIRRAARKETLGQKLRAGLTVREPLLEDGHGCFAKEVLASHDPTIVAAVEQALALREKALTRVIRDSDVDLKPLRLTAPKLARLLSRSMRGFIQQADRDTEARELANALVRLIEHATDCKMKQ